jgi:hypothetical protein
VNYLTGGNPFALAYDQLPLSHALVREFKNYKWKKDQAGKATNKPIDKFNHGITLSETALLS